MAADSVAPLNRIDPEQIAELETLLAEATPVPWDVEYDVCDCGGEFGCQHGQFATGLIVPTHEKWRTDGDECDRTQPGDHWHHHRTVEMTTEDVDLIAALRNAAPLLLAEVKAQREGHAELIDTLNRVADERAAALTERNEARAQVEAVRALLADWRSEEEGEAARGLEPVCTCSDALAAALGTADQPQTPATADDEELSDGYVYRVKLGKRTWVCGGLPAAENARDALGPDAFIERQRVRYGDWVRVDPAAAADQPLEESTKENDHA